MKTTPVILFAAVAIILAAAVSAQKPATHPVADDKTRCASCHVEQTPTKESKSLRPDIDSACSACHQRNKTNHRVGNVPPFSVPSDLVLSPDGKLSCITCHNPHTPRWSEHLCQAQSLAGMLKTAFVKRHPTYFLRRNNAHGDLCLACHRALKEK